MSISKKGLSQSSGPSPPRWHDYFVTARAESTAPMSNAEPPLDRSVEAARWRDLVFQRAVRLSRDRSVPRTSVPQCLDTDELDEVRFAVLEFEPYWVSRPGNFATLGAASYLDAAQSHSTYVDLFRRHNSLLADRFSHLYEIVSRALARLLDSPVVIADDLALPGFHVFGAISETSRPAKKPTSTVSGPSRSQMSYQTKYCRSRSLLTCQEEVPRSGGGP